MCAVRRLLTARIESKYSSASVLQAVLTTVGVITFVAGVLYLPTLGPSRVEAILAYLLLATVTLGCTAVGQLGVVIEKLEKK